MAELTAAAFLALIATCAPNDPDPRYANGGTRAFNYGNIGVTHGQTRAFGSPQEGLAALEQTLLAYQGQHGIDTLAGVINRWAPPEENPTAELIRNAATRTGIDPNKPLDLRDAAIRRKLTEAIIVQEHSQLGMPLDASCENAGKPQAGNIAQTHPQAAKPAEPQGWSGGGFAEKEDDEDDASPVDLPPVLVQASAEMPAAGIETAERFADDRQEPPP